MMVSLGVSFSGCDDKFIGINLRFFLPSSLQPKMFRRHSNPN